MQRRSGSCGPNRSGVWGVGDPRYLRGGRRASRTGQVREQDQFFDHSIARAAIASGDCVAPPMARGRSGDDPKAFSMSGDEHASAASAASRPVRRGRGAASGEIRPRRCLEHQHPLAVARRCAARSAFADDRAPWQAKPGRPRSSGRSGFAWPRSSPTPGKARSSTRVTTGSRTGRQLHSRIAFL